MTSVETTIVDTMSAGKKIVLVIIRNDARWIVARTIAGSRSVDRKNVDMMSAVRTSAVMKNVAPTTKWPHHVLSIALPRLARH